MSDSDGDILDKRDDEARQAPAGPAAAGLPARAAPGGEPEDAASAAAPERREAYETLPLLPYPALEDNAGTASERRVRAPWRTLGAVAGVGLLLAAGGLAVGYDHVETVRARAAEARRDSALASKLGNLASRLDSIEANRGQQELGELKKVLSEVRSGASTARDLSGALAQLAARVDHIEKDQGARLDRLGDRIDHDAAARLADIAGRLDRLEKKSAAVATIAPPPLPTSPKVLPPPKPDAAKAEPPVSGEITGSIEKPKPRLRNYFIDEFRGDYALIEGPGGAQSVSQGDYIPGAGRVLRFERHGHDWAIVTSQGVIVNGDEPF